MFTKEVKQEVLRKLRYEESYLKENFPSDKSKFTCEKEFYEAVEWFSRQILNIGEEIKKIEIAKEV